MNVLSNRVAVEGYLTKSETENSKTIIFIPQMTNKGVIVHKVICDNTMLSNIGVTERTKILVDGRMISGVIHARHILRLN